MEEQGEGVDEPNAWNKDVGQIKFAGEGFVKLMKHLNRTSFCRLKAPSLCKLIGSAFRR